MPEQPRTYHSPKRAPTWLLVLMLPLTALMVPLLWAVNTEDAALSSTTTATQRAGGRDVSPDGGAKCRDAPVEYEAGGRRLDATTYADGGCLTGEQTASVELRYDPDHPERNDTGGRQWVVPGLIVIALLGFLANAGSILHRIWQRLRRRHTASV